MGVLADFFIATDPEVFASFRGWKRPAPLLDEYLSKTVANPFTGQSETFRTRIRPQQPEADADAVSDGDFRALPWIDQKGITTVEILELATILMGWDDEQSDSEVHGRIFRGPEETNEVLCEMPAALVARLADLHSDEVERLGRDWSICRRKDAESLSSADALGARPDTEWVSRLAELSGLAKRAVAERRGMFLWLCP